MRSATVRRVAAGLLLSRYGQLCEPISKRKYRASRTVNVFLTAISCDLSTKYFWMQNWQKERLIAIYDSMFQNSRISKIYSIVH